MEKIVSVVVCTFRRDLELRNCVQSLLAQTANPDRFEILIVDNSPERTAFETLKSEDLPPHFRVVHCSDVGLSHARNFGWKNAKGQFVAYIDDDARAKSDWVGNMLAFIESYPQAQAFGGPWGRYFLTPPPAWLPDSYGTNFPKSEFGPIDISKGEWITGTNMIFKRTLLESLGGFNPRLGMIGGKIGYGEETALIQEIIKRGHSVYFLPHLIVDHLVAPAKYSLRWQARSLFQEGENHIDALNVRPSPFRALKALGGGFWRAQKIMRSESGDILKTTYLCKREILIGIGRCIGLSRKLINGDR